MSKYKIITAAPPTESIRTGLSSAMKKLEVGQAIVGIESAFSSAASMASKIGKQKNRKLVTRKVDGKMNIYRTA